MSDNHPPGKSPALHTMAPTDHSVLLTIATISGMVFSCAAILIRVCMRTGPRPRLSWEGVALAATILVSLTQSSVVLFAIAHGFGKSAGEATYDDILTRGKAIYFGDILFIIAIWMTKCFTAFVFFRQPFRKSHSKSVLAAIITFTAFMFTSVLLLALSCDLPPPGTPIEKSCTALESVRWVVVASLDVASELLLFSLSIYLVSGLRLRLAAKLAVTAVFGARLVLVAPAVLHAHLLRSALVSGDPSLQEVGAAVCVQVEMCIAIASTAAVAYDPFVTALGAQHGGRVAGGVARQEDAIDLQRAEAGALRVLRAREFRVAAEPREHQ
ncbi:hypothetical protein RB601_008918 [Gaeumannomyces tritici]